MKYTFFLLVFTLFVKMGNAQFTPMNLNTTNGLGRFDTLGRTLIVSGGIVDSFYISDTGFDTYSSRVLPCPGWLPDLYTYGKRLYCMCTTLNNLSTKLYWSDDTAQSWHIMYDTTWFKGDTYAMFDTNSGIITGGFFNIVYTQNGGLNWTYDTTNVTNNCSDAIAIEDSLVYMSTMGGILCSKDRGVTWGGGGVTGAVDINNFQVKNRDSIYAIGNSSGWNYFAYTFEGIDSLKTIKYLNSNTHATFMGIYAFNYSEIWILSRTVINATAAYTVLYKTTDLGQTFTMYNTNIPTIYFYRLHFINDSIGFIAGDNGMLLRFNKNELVPTAVKDIDKQTSIRIHPNPVIEKLIITNPEKIEYDIQLVNVVGCIMFKKEHILTEQYTIDMSMLPSGYYFYSIKEKNGRVGNGKLIKE